MKGKFALPRVLEHHEPILLVGIPEQELFDFAAAYEGLSVTDKVRVGAGNNEDVINVDVVAGATVTVMVVNEAIMRSARKVAQVLEIAGGYLSKLRYHRQSLNQMFLKKLTGLS